MMPELLRVQYRMHPGICDFPSRWFYGGKLRTGVGEMDRPLPAGLNWPKPRNVAKTKDGRPKWTAMPVVLVDADRGCESTAKVSGGTVGVAAAALVAEEGGSGAALRGTGRGGGGLSYANNVEAEMVVQAAYALCAAGDVSSLALLTPYRGQVRAIEAQLALHKKAFRALRHSAEIVVSSVDGFQGREADVVIFSSTRNNPRRALGFVRDPRRMNVTITRPRRGLVVIGAPKMFDGDANWGRWLNWCNKYASVVQPEWLPAPPWGTQTRRQAP